MSKIRIILILVMFFMNKSFACLNGETYVLNNGKFIYEDREGNVPYGHIFISDEEYKDTIHELDSLYTATKNLDYLSDKGLLLILLKDYDKAIKLYLKIEKMQPGRYSTASNIGTAYELIGDNEKALHWIKKAVEIDPRSHYNSEWIHVKILEAKIKGQQLATTRFLLNTDFGNETIPTTNLKRDSLIHLSSALYYQLNERVSFVQPKDAIVARLLFDLGNIAFLLGHFGDAEADYHRAHEYGFNNPIVHKRIGESEQRLKLKRRITPGIKKGALNYRLVLGSIIAFATVIAALIILRRKKKRGATRNM